MKNSEQNDMYSREKIFFEKNKYINTVANDKYKAIPPNLGTEFSWKAWGLSN